MAIETRHNEDKRRYEILVDDVVVGIADVDVEGETMVFPHTQIDPSMRGRGLGERLVRDALDDARERGFKVIGSCWFVRDFIRDHPEYADLKAS